MTLNQSTMTRSPISAIQRRKLAELYRAQAGCAEIDALRGLDALFLEAFKHPIAEASYEEGARITARLLAEQRNPAPVQPLAPSAVATQPTPSTTAEPVTAPTAPKEDDYKAAASQELAESPYSWNTFAEAPDGFGEQFTIRAATSEAFVKKIEGIKSYLTAKGYKPQARGSRQPGSANTSQDGNEPVPNCAIHHTPMQKRQSNKGGFFWSCPQKLETGEWCPYRPNQK